MGGISGARRQGGERDHRGVPVVCARGTGPALAGARQWIPQEHIDDPVISLVMGLLLDPGVPDQGAASHRPVHGYVRRRPAVRLRLRGRGVRQLHPVAGLPRGPRKGYVLRVRSNFHLALAAGTTMTCAEAAGRLLADKRRREVRSAGRASKGDRWYAWAWLGTVST